VKPGDVAFNGDGLVGKVDSVRRHVATIRLVTNSMSAVSAKVEPSNVRGLVEAAVGDPGHVILNFISASKRLGVGQEIRTSGWRDDQIASDFPANIPIGAITRAPPSRLEATGSVSVKLYADMDNLDIVQILTGCRSD
jgi:cell shape-determining protein MreC